MTNSVTKQIDDEAKNHNFMQINRKYWRLIGDLSRENKNAFDILWLLAEKCNKQNAVVVSIDTLSKFINRKRTTTSQAIKFLEENKWLQIIKIGTSNAYVLNSAVFWRSRGDLKYTSFYASVIATRDEQSKTFDESVELKHIPILKENERLIIADDPDEETDFGQSEIDLD